MPAIKQPLSAAAANTTALPDSQDAWTEFAHVYPLYAALTRQCGLTPPPYPQGSVPSPWTDKKAMERDLAWLQNVDRQTQAVHLRQLLGTPSAAKEESLRAFLRRQLLKPDKGNTDRDKIDLLVVQYFALCATPELIAAGLDLENVAAVLRPALGEAETVTLECCEPLEGILAATRQCHSLHEFFEGGLMEQSRMAKEAAGGMFYDPAALIGFCRFNFLFRRLFIQLLHGDLRAIGDALIELDRKGIKTVDCRRAGFSASEPVAKLREFQQQWRAPFQNDYVQAGAFRSYEQLLTLRSDLEDALAGVSGSQGGSASASPTATAKPAASVGDKSLAADTPSTQKPRAIVSPPVTSAPSAPPASAGIPSPALTADECEERLWEQLIAAPPARGRSMATITLEDNTRVLLSAWEVAAFVSESGSESEEIRRAIVARAMLAMAIDRWRRFLDARVLHDALGVAREEVPRFQEHIEELKRAKKVESAVNLGITLKRLLSVVEEAEQLQRGTASEEKR